jgi:histone-lysine N-methyltransferase SETMAR
MNARSKRTGGAQPAPAAKLPTPCVRDFRVMIFYDFTDGLTAKECCQKLARIFKKNAPKKTMVFKWFQRFSTGHFNFDDDKREPKPRSSTDGGNADRVKEFLEEDGRVTIRKIALELGMTRYAVDTIIRRDLGFTKKSARWVPRLLTAEQKQARVDWCKFFLDKFNNGQSRTFKMITTGDETWIYNLDPETKSQSMVWPKKGAPPPLKVWRIRSVKRTMFAIFFNMDGIVASIPLMERKTVTSEWYTTQCLPEVFSAMARGRCKNLRRHFLHHDNAPAHTANATKRFIEESGVNVLDPLPYSPDLAPCDFWLFPKLKEPLRGHNFETREELIAAVQEQLDNLPKSAFCECFAAWVRRAQKCIEVGGEYLEKV